MLQKEKSLKKFKKNRIVVISVFPMNINLECLCEKKISLYQFFY